jgi:NTP pyrophosphatase (non-canonical NTP hydrolase)
MNAAQLAVADFVQRHGLEADVEHRLLDLVSEVGELAKEVLKSTQYGRAHGALTPNWQVELGDVLFSLHSRALAVPVQSALAGSVNRRALAANAAGSRNRLERQLSTH